jgi:hypothetical protein
MMTCALTLSAMDHLNFIDCGFDSTAAILATGCADAGSSRLGALTGKRSKSGDSQGRAFILRKNR